MYQSGATGNVTAKIQGHTGTYGSTGVPNGTVYATSDPVIVTSYITYQAVNFSFPSGYVFDSAENYFLTIEGTAGDVQTVYYGVDTTAPVSHSGSYAMYASSLWTSYGTVTDLLFIIYGDGGEIVSFNNDGDVYITEITEVTNVTAEITTGDVNVGGVTAEFNNTAVTAGDVTAGDVTAGDIVGGTYNMTLTGDVISEGGGTSTELYVYSFIIFFLIVLNLLMYMYDKGYFLSSMVGILSIGLVAASFSPTINAYIVFSPWLQTMLLCISIICMIGKIRTTR